MKKRFYLAVLFSICLSMLVCGGQPAMADVEFKDLGTAVDSAQIGFDQFLFYRIDTDPYHGMEVEPGDTDTNFGEIVSKLRVTAAKNMGFANVEAQFALIYMSTIGLDVYLTSEDEDDLTVNQAWLKFGKLFDGPFTLTLGEQNVQIEKQLLVGIGQYNKYASWLFQDQSFPFAVQLDGDFGAVKTNFFWAESRDYWQNFNETWLSSGDFVDNVEVVGVNIHYDIKEGTYIYGGLIAKIDNSDAEVPGLFVADSQTLNWDFGANITLGNLLLEGELVYQTGDAGSWTGVEQDRDAMGGFVSAKMSFGGKLAPWVMLQYDYFSGDEDFNSGTHDSDMEAFDPMFYGFPGWGRWFIGEVAGELHLDNSNKHVFLVEAGFAPHPTTTVTFLYLYTQLDEKYAWLTPVSDDEWSNEANILIDCFPNDNLWLHLGLGYAEPGDAAEELLGDDGNFFAQVLIGFFL